MNPKEARELRDELEELKKERDGLRAQLRAASLALLKFGEHETGCPMIESGWNECVCGYDRALVASQDPEEDPF